METMTEVTTTSAQADAPRVRQRGVSEFHRRLLRHFESALWDARTGKQLNLIGGCYSENPDPIMADLLLGRKVGDSAMLRLCVAALTRQLKQYVDNPQLLAAGDGVRGATFSIVTSVLRAVAVDEGALQMRRTRNGRWVAKWNPAGPWAYGELTGDAEGKLSLSPVEADADDEVEE
jgi:hypothetical protein